MTKTEQKDGQFVVYKNGWRK